MDYHEQWQTELSEIANINIHLLLYDVVHNAVNKSSVLIFESPEAHENHDEDFERDLGVLLNKE